MTAATWECPFFQVKMDMSWVNWVMTANSRQGLPEPFQSRCVVLDLPDLTTGQLRDFAINEAARRGLWLNPLGTLLRNALPGSRRVVRSASARAAQPRLVL
ncbi:hypothetical protein [Ruegeria sp. HKCCE3926]|nr:hypothetical protein [Ruegeria sp. HKCCE3926]